MVKSKNKNKLQTVFEKFATKTTHATGSTGAFIFACSIVFIWMLTGPVALYFLIHSAFVNIDLHGKADINKPLPWIIILLVFMAFTFRQQKAQKAMWPR